MRLPLLGGTPPRAYPELGIVGACNHYIEHTIALLRVRLPLPVSPLYRSFYQLFIRSSSPEKTIEEVIETLKAARYEDDDIRQHLLMVAFITGLNDMSHPTRLTRVLGRCARNWFRRSGYTRDGFIVLPEEPIWMGDECEPAEDLYPFLDTWMDARKYLDVHQLGKIYVYLKTEEWPRPFLRKEKLLRRYHEFEEPNEPG